MVRLYRRFDVELKGYYEGKRVIGFSEDLSRRPREFRGKSFVELLTENKDTMYSLKQIRFDEEKGIYFPVSFAVNYGALRVDSAPLVRGFIPEGPWAQNQTLYEIMPKKKEIHVIPNPSGQLFYEESKVSPSNTFYFEGALKEVLEAFELDGFTMKHFPPGFNALTMEDLKRYFMEDGFEYVKEGIPV